MNSKEILELINKYFAEKRYDRQPASLYEPVKYTMALGGKRIRPTLMMLTYKMYRDDVAKILPTACALEMYHNSTLLHDDLMDNAEVRRGKTTVHRKWDANTAILSGDTMLLMSFNEMMSCGDDKLPSVMRLFSETTLEIDEGQQYDMDFETRDDVREEEYIEMIRLKTSVLLACATEMGALLADAPDADAKRLYKFGEQLGLAFQLQDDYLDVYGDPKVFGKAIGGDILCNKKTYMLINALNKADENQKERLTKWLSATDYDPQQKIREVTEIYNELGIDRLAQDKINYYFTEARKQLDMVSVVDERKQDLRLYTDQMLRRDR
ncbi:MAG: polyprenyl synthetase family protein [Prevotella sp.]|nr:polyprenyl synthetase family protein [Prevotella sp.]